MTTQYSLVLQDETDPLDDVEDDDEVMMIMSEEDGLCALVCEGETEPVDEDEDEGETDSEEEEIFSSSRHRGLSNEGAKLNGQINLGMFTNRSFLYL